MLVFLFSSPWCLTVVKKREDQFETESVVKYCWKWVCVLQMVMNKKVNHAALNPLTLYDCEDDFMVRVQTKSVYSTPVRPWVLLCQARDSHVKCVSFIANTVSPILLFSAVYQDVFTSTFSLAEIFDVGECVGVCAFYFESHSQHSCYRQSCSLP